MSYLKNWRRYRAEAECMAKSSDDEDVAPELEALNSTVTRQENVEETQGINSSTDEVAEYNPNTRDVSSSDKDPISSENDDGSLSSSLEEKDENASQDSSQELEIDLAVWATKNKCTRSALNELLAILRKQGLRLPKDARILLRTPRTVDVVEKCGGNYFYMGIGKWCFEVDPSKCRLLCRP